MKTLLLFISLLPITSFGVAQNSMVGDGFGGRLWYTPTNYAVSSYSAYSICNEYEDSTHLYGWGTNLFNRLGIGVTNPGVTNPIPIPNMNDVKYVSGGYLGGAIKKDGTGWVWGGNAPGFFAANPVQIITDVKFLDAGAGSLSFIKNDGTVWSIGEDNWGTFGSGSASFSQSIIPVLMININNAVRVSVSSYRTIILLADSTVWSTGDNSEAGLGVSSTIPDVSTPVQVNISEKIIDIKSTAAGTIALTASGDVYFWGADLNASLTFTPTKITGLANIVAISGCDDGYHFMALDEDKYCYAWESNQAGQLGGGLPISNNSFPVQLVDSNVIDIMAGESFSYIVKSDGSLWAAGISHIGNLGESIWLNLSNVQRTVFTEIDPSLVPGACNVVVTSVFNTPKIKGFVPRIYPNPSSTNLFIESDVAITKVKIFDISGKLILEDKLIHHQIDISSLTRGMYIIRVFYEKEVYTSKFSKI